MVTATPFIAPSETRIDPYDLDEAEDLRGSFLRALMGLVGVLAWITAIRASACNTGGLVACGWLTPVALGVSASVVVLLRALPKKLLCSIFMVCLFVSTELEWVFTQTQAAPYFFSLLVVVASMLFTTRGALATVFLALAGLAWGATINKIGLAQTSAPVIFLLFTSVVAWLGTRQFLTALGWSSFSNKQAQAAAADARQHRAELMVRSHDLDQAYARLERMNQMLILARQVAESARLQKSQFANAVSHELRSPINMIIGFSDLMVNARDVYIGQQWTPRLSQHLSQVFKSGQHLSQLIDDVLDLARIDSYRMTLNKTVTNISEIIMEAVEITRELFSARGLYLRVVTAGHSSEVNVDRIRIRQVLLNLITNAARFTNAGGVTVRAHALENEMVVEVEDTGAGISAPDLAGLFQEFHQADSSPFKQGRGTSGLGLVISKRLVEQHGGRIYAESMPGAGSRFVFTLPIQANPTLTHDQYRKETEDAWWPALEREARKRMRVLIQADDSARRLVTTSLSNYDLIWHDEKKGLAQQISDQFPAAMVCVGTPTGNGRRPDATTLGQLAGLPVIVCSLPTRLAEPLPAPFAGALVKPVGREQLARALSSLGGSIERILIVDDDEGMVEFLQSALSAINPGWQIQFRRDGQTALEAMPVFRPDVVLLDFGLPDTTGRELAVKLRFLSPAHIIAVTAEDLATAMSATDTDYITYLRSGHLSQLELETMLESMVNACVRSTNGSSQNI